jgi:hypothetical protein
MSNTLISPSKVKRFILDYASKNRAHKFTRVSQTAIDKIEGTVRASCRYLVDSAPSKGKTL